MADLRDLIYKRASIKSQVTRLLNFFESDAQKTKQEARVRQSKLEDCWTKFEEIQMEIDLKQADAERSSQQLGWDGDAERQLFEASYYKIAEKIEVILNQQDEVRENPHEKMIYDSVRNRPRLPEIKLSEFNGDYTKWLFFKNSFETTIDQETGLTQMQKHQYLVGTLKGEALKVIQGYQITNENYTHAWKLLKDTYDNAVIIVETHIDKLLQFPTIPKDDKADGIRKFVWHIRTHMSALKSLSQPVDQWQTLLIHMAKKKLDYVEQRDWQNTINERTPNNMPTMEEFLKFLTDRCNALRVLDQGKTKPPTSKPAIQRKPDKRVSLTVTTWECHFCKGNHSIYRCDDFKKLTPDQRKREIVSQQICVNCLGPGHMVRQCRASSCKRCSGRHNTMLHKETEPQSKETEPQSSETNLDASEVAMIACHGQRTVSTVLLSTARVNAYDVDGNSHPCRVLLDPGSQSNVITESLVERLRLPKTSEMRAISGINQSRNHTANTTDVRITSQQEVYETILACLILPSITEKLSQVKIDVKKLFIPRDGRMADPTFWEPGNIDILIGAGLYWRILMGSPRNRIDGQPSLQNTRLGWIIGGEVPVKPPELSLSYLGVTNDTLNRQVERFWKQEKLLEPPQYSEEEKECEQQFVKTSKPEPDGRFIVQLPKRAHIVLGDSREQATRRLFALERRFRRNTQLKDEYVKFMNDYLEQGHMSIVQDENQEGEIYFLPHQAVLRSQSVTTKLRVVFDPSAKTTTGTSLNDKLIPGPNLQKDLFDIILRFRTYEYVMTADVAMMYRQIKVDAKDRPLQRILWRKSQDEPV